MAYKNRQAARGCDWQVFPLFFVQGLPRHVQGRQEEGIDARGDVIGKFFLCSLYKDYQDTYKGGKRKESMQIYHFLFLQLFHPKFLKIKCAKFLHDNHSSFIHQFTTNQQQEYTNFFAEFPS
jgi:hypothetical protein